MKIMTEAKFNQMKVMAQVFGKEHIDSRIHLMGLVALENAYNLEHWPEDYEYEIDGDIACMNAVAQIKYDWKDEVNGAVDTFYIKYFNADIYHSGNYQDCFTDPMKDLNMTLSQVQIIEDIIRDEMHYGIEDSGYNNEEIVNEIINWLEDKDLTEKRLMNDINDLIN